MKTLDEIVVEAASLHITMGDLERNYQNIKRKIFDSVAKGIDLLVLPELTTTGYAIGDEFEIERLLENNRKVVDRLIEETKDIDTAVAIGFVDYDKEKIGNDGRIRRYNAAMVFQKGKVKGVVHKDLLPNYTLFDEKRWFTTGKDNRVIEIDVGKRKVKLGVGICEMKWVEDYREMARQDQKGFLNPAVEYKKQGAELLVWLNASPFHAGKIWKIDSINRARVVETGLPLVDSNLVGIGDNGYDLFGFAGESSIMDSSGNYISVTRPWKEESAVARINLENGAGKLIEGQKERDIEDGRDATTIYVDQVLDGLIYMSGEFVRQSPCNVVLESMSGGIDSSVGTTIAELARKQVFFNELRAYTFPTQFNTETTKNSSHQVAENLGLDLEVISIQEEFEQKVKKYARRVMSAEDFLRAQKEFQNIGVEAFYSAFRNPNTPENIQARLRSEHMKLFSNEYNAIEFVNPNKDERRQGYTTLWGDMAGSFMLLGDVDKWLVKSLARRINQRYGKIIPNDLIYNVNPSAELSEKQNPEKGGGDPFEYTTLGIILDNYTFSRKDVPAIVEDFKNRRLDPHFIPGAERIYDQFSQEEFEEKVTEYLVRNESMRYKNVVAPLAPKVTRRALGFELRTPVTSHYFRSLERRKQEGFY